MTLDDVFKILKDDINTSNKIDVHIKKTSENKVDILVAKEYNITTSTSKKLFEDNKN